MGLLSFGKKPVEQLIKEGVKSEAELRQLITEACQRGAVHCTLFFDAHGRDKKATEDALVELVANLTKEKGVLYCKGEVENSVEGEGMFSSFATVDLVTASLNALVNIALHYGPTSVAILEPDKLFISPKEAQDIILDASQNTQQYSRFILESSMNEEQKRDFAETIKRKAEHGAKLRDKATQSKN